MTGTVILPPLVFPDICVCVCVFVCIYKTKNHIFFCVSDCLAKSLDVDGTNKTCEFPFSFRNKTYHSCTYDYNEHLSVPMPWCSLKTGSWKFPLIVGNWYRCFSILVDLKHFLQCKNRKKFEFIVKIDCPGACAIKLLHQLSLLYHNKLECLSMLGSSAPA
jgi:hypothetical protein